MLTLGAHSSLENSATPSSPEVFLPHEYSDMRQWKVGA
jgi:hypothetical protein